MAGGKTASKAEVARRLAALRGELKARALDGFIVPHADEYQGEYLPASAERLAWISGFTGSAGTAVVLADKAALFVDGRYTIQARQQVDAALFEHCHLIEQPPQEWLADNLKPGQSFGYDPWLHTESQKKQLEAAVAKADARLVATEGNPLDAVWSDRPKPPSGLAVAHDIAFAGRTSADKRAEIAEALARDGADAVVLTLSDSIAWLLNVRGSDVPHCPFVLSFAVLASDGRVTWFVDPAKIRTELARHLDAEVMVVPPSELGATLDALGKGKLRVRLDPDTAAAWIFERLRAAGAAIVAGPDPCQLPKAKKNEIELEGTRAAHRRDGLAVSRFLCWLEGEAKELEAGRNEGLSELAVAEKLLTFRTQDKTLRDLSFDTISGAGPNAALPHYRVTAESNRNLASGEIYLVDSGGQYPDGTTDITRTVAIGTPSEEMRRHFTLVLKGHIALATQRFPRGTTGSQLDALARMYLWQDGLDYDHGTGHGVGSYLSVHEGPQRISKVPNRTPLEPGMIVSNEPGYYRDGAYGIRIENLVAVVESPAPNGKEKAKRNGGDERPMLAFETLTLAPIDRRLIDLSLLTEAERAWLDAYHARVRETHLPHLKGAEARWLEWATAKL